MKSLFFIYCTFLALLSVNGEINMKQILKERREEIALKQPEKNHLEIMQSGTIRKTIRKRVKIHTQTANAGNQKSGRWLKNSQVNETDISCDPLVLKYCDDATMMCEILPFWNLRWWKQIMLCFLCWCIFRVSFHL